MFLIIPGLWFVLLVFLKPNKLITFGLPFLILPFISVLLFTSHTGQVSGLSIFFYLTIFASFIYEIFNTKN